MTIPDFQTIMFSFLKFVGDKGEHSLRKVRTIQWKIVGKIFLHGILFSVFYIILYFAWIFMLLVLVSLGHIIGLIIGIGFLFLGIGYINAILGAQLWDVEANTEFWSIFFHGLVLFIILLIVNLITSTLPLTYFPGTATYVVTLIISSFLNGVIGKKVSSWFGQEIKEDET